MEQFFVDLFQSNPDAFKYWGLLIIFAVTFFESLPLLGALLPGQILVIFAGFLVKMGVIAFWPAFEVAAIGAVLGDLAGFALGRRYGGALMQRKIWKMERKHFEATTHLLEQNSIKSIFIGRLHSFTRTLMPFAAGMSRMSARRFITVDIITAVVWAVLSLSVGFIFGGSFELATSFVGRFILWATLAAIALSILVYQMRKHGKKIAWLDASLIGISIGSLYLFAVVAQSFSSGRLFRILDLRMEAFVLSHQVPWIQGVMMFWSNLGAPMAMTALASVFILFLISQKKWRDAIFTGVALGIGVVFVDILKALFQRARPMQNIIDASGTSFPSGHALMAVVAAIVLYYVWISKIKRDGLRNTAIVISCIIAFAIGLSRVYLNVHWATDVLAGFLGGVFFGTFAIILFRLFTHIVQRSKRSHSLPDIP